MLYIEFKDVKTAQRYNPHATIARQSYANTHVMMQRKWIGRHEYVYLKNRVSGAVTRVYAGHIKTMRTMR